MNPIVFAMRRPLTIMVLVVAVALGSILAVARLSIDIFPNLNLPVVYVCQPYGGMDPAQMEGLLTNYYEYHFLYIGGIDHVESRNVQGMAIMKLFFQPGTNMAQAMAETIGYVTRSRAFMPPGTVSPFITRFDAGSVPVGYLVLKSETKSIGEIQDQALFRVRPMFAGLPGVSAPPPFGGNQRTIVVRADPERLRSYSISPDELITALSNGNTISPSGNIRIGKMMPIVPINAIVHEIKELEDIPIRINENPGIYVRDVATVSDASDIPAGYALVNGRRAVYILVTKRAEASTLSVVRNVRDALPKMQAVLPEDIQVSFEFDQSPTVTRAVRSLATEGALGALLTGVMVLVFLRDWRSVIVVVLNIPLAICGALVALWITGQSINIMTLGGLALAVGILVDEATVEIENIHRKMEATESIASAVRQGNMETAVPRLLAMLSILAVFLPSFVMQGAPQALFVPLACAVGFAMVSSYLLSSTFVPVLATWLLRHPRAREPGRPSFFDRGIDVYGQVLAGFVRLRGLVVPVYLVLAAAIIVGVGLELGLEIFPKVDAGRFQLRMRCPTGTRIEETEKVALGVLTNIRDELGASAIDISVGYVGLIPSSYPINAIFQWTGGPEEVVLRVALKEGNTIAIEGLKERLRTVLGEKYPDVRFSFEPADIVSEVMSFGSPTPVEVAVDGPNLAENRAHAEKIRAELAQVPSLRDLQFAQALDYPTVSVELDRQKAGLSGVSVSEVARSVLAATSSSRFVVPNYWPDSKSGIGYQVQLEIPYQMMNSINDVESLPIQRSGAAPLLLRDVAKVSSGTMPGEYDRYNMKRVASLTANISGEDLGRVASHVESAIARSGEAPRGATVQVRGQIVPLNEILKGLTRGLLLAIVVIMLLLTATLQSVRLAFIVISTTPAVVAGVVFALWLTGTTVNLQSFMGAIMSIGVAVANAILLVTFAESHRRNEGASAATAAVAGAQGRLRPILMTSCTMIAGMIPMAIGVSEGSEQSAPLGRAVIGGLAAATLATLVVLPTAYALIQEGAGRRSASIDPGDPESSYYEPRLWTDAGRTRNLVSVIVVLGLAATLAGCEQPAARSDHSGGSSVTRVALVRPERATIRRTTEQPGQIEAYEVTAIHARVSGYVEKWNVDIGTRVTRGQVLAVLSVPELDAEAEQKQATVDESVAKLDQAKASQNVAQANVASDQAKLAEVQAGIKRAEAEFARWQAEYKRVAQLFKEHAQTGSLVDETLSKLRASESARDEVYAQVQSAKAALLHGHAMLERARTDVTAATASIKVARSDARRIQAMRGYASIVAPYDGVVTQRNVDVGDLTEPGSHGEPLFTVARDDLVRITVRVPEKYAMEVDPGDQVQVRVQAFKAKDFVGKVTRTAWTLDAKNRTLRTEIDVPNPGGTLRPGLYANTTIIVQEHPNALTVPASAIVRQDSQAFCVVVVDGKVIRKPVTLGLDDGLRVEILSGLEGAQAVVKANAASLASDQVVEVVEPVEKTK
jgi:multidrug efflux pump subunit AcrB/multidrug efflux pump subunit AcrA (membrane-fusion protein)